MEHRCPERGLQERQPECSGGSRSTTTERPSRGSFRGGSSALRCRILGTSMSARKAVDLGLLAGAGSRILCSFRDSVSVNCELSSASSAVGRASGLTQRNFTRILPAHESSRSWTAVRLRRPRLPESLAGRMAALAIVSLAAIAVPIAAWVSPWMLLFVPGVAGLAVSLVALRGILRAEATSAARTANQNRRP